MRKIPAQINSSPPKKALVYRLVFEHVMARVFVVVLLCSFSLQTVERVFAADEEVTNVPAPLISITDETLSTLNSEIEARVDVVETEPELSTVPTEENRVNNTEVASTDSTSTDMVEAVPDGNNSLDSSVGNEIVTEDDVLVPSDTETVVTNSDEILIATSSLLDASTTATTTDESIPTLTVESDQMIQFNKDNCLAVEDGSFYCQEATSTTPTNEKGLYALPDVDGDLEIYIKNGEEMKQITFNTVDDASPYYDPASDSIVWHRIIDERYQIVVYDVASGEETQLTDTSTNNMEPFRSDNIIVWQHWDNDAWQIMLYDGQSIKQLTNTTEHNLAPVVRNNLVVWHRIMYGEKTIEVYDLASKAYMTIRDDQGGNIMNPRMVLVYDAAMDNGDTVTRGYDLVTGEITSFENKPAPLPEEIPDPDQTGETKALLNTKSSTEEEQIDGGVGPESSSASPDLEVAPVLSSSTTMTLDLTSELMDGSIDVATTSSAIPDLVIPSFIASTSPVDIPVVE